MPDRKMVSGIFIYEPILRTAKRRCAVKKVPDTFSPRRELYRRKLVLVRPDQHVAWRGDEEPAAPLDLIDCVRGARTMPLHKTA